MPTVMLSSIASACDGRSKPSSSSARQSAAQARSTDTSSLAIVAVPTPHFRVPRYDTKGAYPQARGRNLDLKAVNAALREAVLADQREYAPYARKNSIGTAKRYRGVYQTLVDRRMLSASTVVVSALMPVTELYPGGSLGKGWLSVTVRVPSGTAVSVSDLFSDRLRGLRALA
ncbi:MAG: hypothetical protein M3R39_07180 [Actinomycetota bacterium]|nr:hypothetical protein [Actinomycetota bacterium]